MKFGNIILAVASMAVIDIMLYFLLSLALIPSIGSYWGMNSAAIVSMLVAALFVGYIFAVRIQEQSRIRTVSKISILFALVMPLSVMMSAAANPYYRDVIDETLKSMYTTSTWTKMDWYVYGQLSLLTVVVLNVVLALVLTFIGTYAGSMLKKPKESQK